ncbi:MAG: thioredoxin family protein [Methylococcaceae bacterium]|nr:thioredoxin family protein [Methylococcaceae bacterium]MDP3905434.1 thioredoxin family protein [Methylococcaceae bacterium]
MLTGLSFAGEEAFTQAAFDQLQKDGKPILVAIHADWCPTCRAQAPIVSKLIKQDEFQAINALRVDFDQQKEVVKEFKATAQSTLIVFKGGQEVGRSLGDTTEDGIRGLLNKTLLGK